MGFHCLFSAALRLSFGYQAAIVCLLAASAEVIALFLIFKTALQLFSFFIETWNKLIQVHL
jgi:hypothetical protein